MKDPGGDGSFQREMLCRRAVYIATHLETMATEATVDLGGLYPSREPPERDSLEARSGADAPCRAQSQDVSGRGPEMAIIDAIRDPNLFRSYLIGSPNGSLSSCGCPGRRSSGLSTGRRSTRSGERSFAAAPGWNWSS